MMKMESLRADVKWSEVLSLRSLLVVEERMSSSGCLLHWLATGRASNLKIFAPVTALMECTFLPLLFLPLPV